MMTSQADPNAMTIAMIAPITTPIPADATAAQTRRIGFGRLYRGTTASAIPIGTRSRAILGSLRWFRGTALAFFRQPAKTRAAIANPAIQAA